MNQYVMNKQYPGGSLRALKYGNPYKPALCGKPHSTSCPRMSRAITSMARW
jgi:hypothetical protein